ncbi:probable leucine-rich repeat receptor-like protein kinase At2g33170, partial [Olea europaea var. sylvestris]|uniref:probable leucine-rich repeat receptor-like protein kinase At2g33170 n=1 Tax=Olea europaea var. sylvestris TaxID=158386 RepID=UPI000C1CFEE6
VFLMGYNIFTSWFLFFLFTRKGRIFDFALFYVAIVLVLQRIYCLFVPHKLLSSTSANFNLIKIMNMDLSERYKGCIHEPKLSSLVNFVAYTNNLTGSLPQSLGNLRNLRTFRAGQNEISGSLPTGIGYCQSLETLGLAQNRIEGNLPKELGMLKSLREVILWENQFSGFIPKELGNCTNLEMLALYQNNLAGGIPAELGNLKSMQRLYLYRNGLNGTIPREIGNLTQALEIDFSENYLSGEIPTELTQIKSLNLLYLFQNELTGVIPNELSSLKKLMRLDLSINRLTGPIPFGFQYLTELYHLLLFSNSLSGSIPQRFGLYSRLWVVDFSENDLTGRIPPHLCRHSNLMLLNLESNKLYGNIPPGVINCISLQQLRLSGNRLAGTFPSDLCKLPKLAAIELGQNKLSGPMPHEVGECQKLQRLDLSGNQFTSELPKEIGNLSQLVSFNVSSNSFTGRIPPEIFHCKALQRLDLSQNSFIDAIPKELGTLSLLERLIVSENMFSGNIPAALGNLSHLTELQMGGNLLSGEIPKELGDLAGLQIALNLSCNNLTGRIPPELGNLILLESLLLNNNHLSGEIPGTFVNLSSLLGCNFSYNDLTGPLPSVQLFQTMSISSFIGNKGLCGGLLGNCSGSTSFDTIPPRVRRSDAPQGKVIILVAAVIGGVSLVLIVVILYLMKRHPVEMAASLQEENGTSSPDSDIYFRPKEGFTFQDLVEATNNFNDNYIIGRGGVGTVYKAVLPSTQIIAVKKLASNREGNNIENSFRAEILTLGNIRHRNIVKLFGFCYHQGSNLLLYEYMARGSLGEFLYGESCDLDWPTRFSIALGAAEGLAYLHHDCRPKIIHRDIKPNNILLDDKFEAHVGDFGLAKVIDMPQSKSMSAVAGSYGYIAPEYAYTMKVTEKCDIYSYGVVLLELLTGKMPVQPLEQGGDLVTWVRNYIREHSLSTGILDSRLNLKDERTTNHMISVLKIALLCTSMSPFDRPTMRQVVLMLMESNDREGNVISPPDHELSPEHDAL